MRRVGCQVRGLEGVGLEVVELRLVALVVDVLVAAEADHEDAGDRGHGVVLGEHRPVGIGALGDGEERAAGQAVVDRVRPGIP